MTDKAIIMDGVFVRALLVGRKKQHRVLLKTAPNARGTDVFDDSCGFRARVPYAIGDRLWVREAHTLHAAHGQHRTDGRRWGPWGGLPTQLSPDRTQIAYFREGFDRSSPGAWRPSTQMPRWASRLTLLVTGVRVQRLQEVSEADATAEGAPGLEWGDERDFGGTPHYRAGFRDLWNSLHAARGFGWDANPWVCAITFKAIGENIDAGAV